MTGRLDVAKVRQEATNKWPSILSACGIDKGFLTNRQGPCPICQEGKDRFRFDDKEGRGTFYCNQCGSGDGFALLQKVKGWGFGETLGEVAALAGSATPIKVRHGRPEQDVRDEMNLIWRAAKPIADVEAAMLWWARRLGQIPMTPELRAVRSLRCSGSPDLPGMVAMVRDANGKPVNLHRTYLAANGERADIPSPRRVMDLEMPAGSAVRLSEATDTLGVAEGIETAESCRVMFGLPTWALLNAGNMKTFVPPPGVRRVVIYGELDGSFTGQAAAFELARRLWTIRKKRDPELSVEVCIHGVTIDPTAWDRDWNDVLQARLPLTERAA